MAVSYSVSATVNRSTIFSTNQIRILGLNSYTATNEFSQSIDLTGILPAFPIIINTGCTTIKFLIIVITGGSVTLRLTKGGSDLDLVAEGTLILSGVDLTNLSIRGTPSGSCYVEFLGMGV